MIIRFNIAVCLLIAVSASAADADLQMWLLFVDNFTNNHSIYDYSGHEAHAVAQGRPGFPTNFPSQISWTNGIAGEFHRYLGDGWDIDYNESGDYGAITNLSGMLRMSNVTLTAWCYYYTALSNNYVYNQTSKILNGGEQYAGAWGFGRDSSDTTRFYAWADVGDPNKKSLAFPDTTATGNSGGWHHYAATFAGSPTGALANIYYNGTNCGSAGWTNIYFFQVNTNITGVDEQYRYSWIGLGVNTHNGSAPMETPGDRYPNNGWLNGALSDVRIYSRVLTAAEIQGIYTNPAVAPDTAKYNIITTGTLKDAHL